MIVIKLRHLLVKNAKKNFTTNKGFSNIKRLFTKSKLK